MAYTETETRNLDMATAMYHEMLMIFDPTHVDRFIAEDYVQHSTAASGGREGLRAFLEDRREGFPEVDIQIKRKLADGDFTIFHIHTIRHPGDPGMNIVDIFRHRPDGKVQEHWEVLQIIPEVLPHDNGIF
ncbi:MAG: ester cyclase [Sphingobium sp.]|nr:ester cyclase [Sphingobium sp.]